MWLLCDHYVIAEAHDPVADLRLGSNALTGELPEWLFGKELPKLQARDRC